MKKTKIALITIACFLAVVPLEVNAHPGNTDSNGGHYDHDTGEYHYHHGYSAHQHYDVDGDGTIDCPYNYVATETATNNYAGSWAGYYLSNGWMSDEEFDNLMNDSFREGHTEGYNSGYEAGYDDGKTVGYDNAVSEIEKEYAEKLETEKDKAYKDGRNLAYFLSFIFGIPAVSHFTSKRWDKKLFEAEKKYNAKLSSATKELNDASYMLNMIAEKIGTTPTFLAESLFVSYQKSRGYSEEEARAYLQVEKSKPHR